MIIYIDEEYKCHVTKINASYREFNVPYLDEMVPEEIENLRYIPKNEEWALSEEIIFRGEAIMPVLPSLEMPVVLSPQLQTLVDTAVEVEVEPLAQVMHNIKNAIPESLQGIVSEFLTSVPVDGEKWSASKNYIQGDTVMFETVSYTALKYSKNKAPNAFTEHWKVTPTDITYEAWDSYHELYQFNKNDITVHDGQTWNCIKQNLKSILTEPKDGSKYWEVYNL